LRARQAAGMKQEVVAKKAGLSDASLRKIENGLGPLHNNYIELICKSLGLNYDAVLLEAITNLRCALLERLGRDPESPLYDLQEKRKAALTARHEAERKQLEADLEWDNSLYLKRKMFVNRE
jgi:transcriptional regulator with XRE-family HTH domain